MTLAEWFEQSSLSRQAFAAQLGKSPSLVSHWIRGDRKPLIDDIVAIQKLTRGKVKPSDWINVPLQPPRWQRRKASEASV